MKTGMCVKMGACGLFCIMMAGCSDYSNFTPPTSHYVSGKYACYYHDVRNGQLYKGVDNDKNTAARAARYACINRPPKDVTHEHCQFAVCIFK
jgi:hypothetical protein